MTVERSSPRRVVTVLAGLAAAGAVVGGFAGAATLAIMAYFDRDPFAVPHVSYSIPLSHHVLVSAIRGLSGAVIGFVAAPLAGWLVLRRVPLGQALGGLALGTILGWLITWEPPFGLRVLVHPVAAASIGFLVSALLLRVVYLPER